LEQKSGKPTTFATKSSKLTTLGQNSGKPSTVAQTSGKQVVPLPVKPMLLQSVPGCQSSSIVDDGLSQSSGKNDAYGMSDQESTC